MPTVSFFAPLRYHGETPNEWGILMTAILESGCDDKTAGVEYDT
jgi:hypothetical protein